MMRRMLIVDDEPTIRWALRELFMQDGWQVDCAEDAEAGMELLAGARYDYVITDLKMAGPCGVDLARSVREHCPHAGVTILTGYPSLDTAVEALRLRVWDYVTKPCDSARLKRRIDEFLDRAPAPGPSDAAPLTDSQVAEFLGGAGTDLVREGRLRPDPDGPTAWDHLGDALRDLGLGSERRGQLIQSCIDVVALAGNGQGATLDRVGLLAGHVLVAISAPGDADAARAATEHSSAEVWVLAGSNVVVSEAI